VVNGKRIKTIDVHAHCCVPKAMALIKHPLEAPGLLMTDTSVRIAAMDAQGIDVEALSINPYWYKAERDVAAQLIKLQNETLVEFCAANPDRFVAFATAALQHPDLAAEQVEHAVKKLGFRGVGVGGSVAGEELANPRFHPFWAKCEELGVWSSYPLGTRAPGQRPAGRQRPADQQSAARWKPRCPVAPDLRGTLDRFGLKICAAHGGGAPHLRQPVGCGSRTFPSQIGHCQRKPPRAAALLRHHRVAQALYATCCGKRSWPDHDRDRLPVPVDQHGGRPRAQHPGVE
jgi:aminocarboxymuconate-semialdehyde decarboxylase